LSVTQQLPQETNPPPQELPSAQYSCCPSRHLLLAKHLLTDDACTCPCHKLADRFLDPMTVQGSPVAAAGVAYAFLCEDGHKQERQKHPLVRWIRTSVREVQRTSGRAGRMHAGHWHGCMMVPSCSDCEPESPHCMHTSHALQKNRQQRAAHTLCG